MKPSVRRELLHETRHRRGDAPRNASDEAHEEEEEETMQTTASLRQAESLTVSSPLRRLAGR